jgi:threonine/homoserine/homoserine lactone efflux protein
MTFFSSELLVLATLNFFALLSPGPNFAMIAQHSLTVSRLKALSIAGGIAMAGYIHQLTVIGGLGLIISQAPLAMKIIHICGTLYLAYLGIQSLQLKSGLSRIQEPVNEEKMAPLPSLSRKVSVAQGFIKGFIFNLLNPVSLLFFLGIFSSAINNDTSWHYQVFYATLLALMDFSWHSLTALVFSHNRLQKKIFGHRLLIDRIAGVILLGIALHCLYGI